MRLQFPEGFLLGVSSASAQIEGGEVGSNWNDWYHQGRIKDDSDPAVADDHWNRWREDCALMAGLSGRASCPRAAKSTRPRSRITARSWNICGSLASARC